MTAITAISLQDEARRNARTAARDPAIDTMRGIAILLVIGIHSLQQPLVSPWGIIVDAVLRPCVPIFLFTSGLLTARSGRIVLWKRINAALVPYAIAFIAAYAYMAAHNPAMDQRIETTAARFVLGYVFVYYYVFVYLGCTVMLWLVYWAVPADAPDRRQRIAMLLLLSIAAGLTIGAYLDPLLLRRGVSASVVEEVRMRDIPFWFCFAAFGALLGLAETSRFIRDHRLILIAAIIGFYVIYVAVRIFGIGDAADYDSIAFFAFAALFCSVLVAFQPRIAALAAIGSGSYFIYLWHIFAIMILRDHSGLRNFGAIADSMITYVVAVTVSVAALMLIRSFAPSRLIRWMGA
jgi:peptidoglycan/LPS O-acetylase OafA/YrhL